MSSLLSQRAPLSVPHLQVSESFGALPLSGGRDLPLVMTVCDRRSSAFPFSPLGCIADEPGRSSVSPLSWISFLPTTARQELFSGAGTSAVDLSLVAVRRWILC